VLIEGIVPALIGPVGKVVERIVKPAEPGVQQGRQACTERVPALGDAAVGECLGDGAVPAGQILIFWRDGAGHHRSCGRCER
jgi:hypothetical protein